MKRSLGARTLAFPLPVWVVATYDADGKPNVMTASWAGICCSRPPCLQVSLRRVTYTHGCLERRKAFTVNVPGRDQIKQADYFGIASGRNADKLQVTGLTAVKSDNVDAPYIDEFPLVLECTLAHVVRVGLHTMFVGEIVDVRAEEAILDERGLPDVERLDPLVFSPEIRVYHGLGENLGQAFSIGREFEK